MKKKINMISQITFGVVTLLLVSTLVPFALVKGQAKEDELIICKVKEEQNVKHEYIVGQEFNPNGLSLIMNDKTIESEDLNIDYDFTSAGEKVVKLSYKENSNYIGYFPVNVYYVRHLDLRSPLISFDKNKEIDLSNFVCWADLSTYTGEMNKPEGYNSISDSAVILDNDALKITYEELSPMYYKGVVRVNQTAKEFKFNTDPDRVIDFESSTFDGLEHLRLYVNENTNNYVAPNGTNTIWTNGTYVYTDPDGNKSYYSFKFEINGWTSVFGSASQNGNAIIDSLGYEGDNDAMKVVVNGTTFFSRGINWHKAVLNMEG